MKNSFGKATFQAFTSVSLRFNVAASPILTGYRLARVKANLAEPEKIKTLFTLTLFKICLPYMGTIIKLAFFNNYRIDFKRLCYLRLQCSHGYNNTTENDVIS